MFRRDVELGTDDVIGAALSCPAFATDLSIWRLNIHRDGTVTQVVHKSQPPDYQVEQVILHCSIDPATVARLLALADEIQFAKLDDSYSCNWTDQQDTMLKVRCGDSVKVVNAYGPHAAAYEGNADMTGYVRLWDAIVELSPFVPYRD